MIYLVYFILVSFKYYYSFYSNFKLVFILLFISVLAIFSSISFLNIVLILFNIYFS